MVKFGFRLVPVALAVLLAASAAEAGGVAIGENGRQLGNANSGGAALAEDATTIWWNPAGLTRIRRHQVAGAAYGVFFDSISDVQGSNVSGIPTGGDTKVNGGGEATVVPALFVAYSLSDRWKIGLGINTPFALPADFGSEWTGRYYADEGQLAVVNMNLAAAYRINRCWSVGGGLNFQYATTSLSNAVDLGTITNGGVGPPTQADGHVDLSGESFGLGFNIGVLYEPNNCWRFGAHYRSRVKHTFEGEADFTTPEDLSPLFTDTDSTVDLDLPDSVSVSAYHQLTRKWGLMADITWTNWSLWDQADVDFDNPAQPDQAIEFDWSNTWRFGIGAIYQLSRRWSFRAGLAWDMTPIPSKTRTPLIQEGDTTWIGMGVGYRLNRCWQIDMTYLFAFSNARIRQSVDNPNNIPRGNLNGKSDNTFHALGFQVTYDF